MIFFNLTKVLFKKKYFGRLNVLMHNRIGLVEWNTMWCFLDLVKTSYMLLYSVDFSIVSIMNIKSSFLIKI